MGKARNNLEGMIFTNLTVLRQAESRVTPNGSTKTRWYCSCTCGNFTIVDSEKLTKGKTKSCGCREFIKDSKFAWIRKELGKDFQRNYKHYIDMLTRCFNEKSIQFCDYGGRGITVCDYWRESFANFYKDMGAIPENMSLDRIDVNGNYELSNCRWVSREVQSFNKRPPKGNKFKTGVTKVSNGKWVAKIRVGGKVKHLGTFEVYEDAVEMREKFEMEVYGFTKE